MTETEKGLPMRDLARSMMRCSWALTVFGTRQAFGLAGERDGSSERALDAVTLAAEDQLDEMSRSVYRTGERLQGGAFDLVSDLMADLAAAGGAWDPRRLVERATGRAAGTGAGATAAD